MLNRYIIERKVPKVGESSTKDFSDMAEKSNEALHVLGPDIQWLRSYVTDDKIFCEYLAKNEELVREHARLGGFPADNIFVVKQVLDPTSAVEDTGKFRPDSILNDQTRPLNS